MQTERDSNEQGEDTQPDRVLGRPGRRGSRWFSFDLPVDAVHPMALMVTYSTQEFAQRMFDVLINGTRVGSQTVERRGPGSAAATFFDVQYAIPNNLVQAKKIVTVRFQSTDGKEIAAIFGIRTIRADLMQPVDDKGI